MNVGDEAQVPIKSLIITRSVIKVQGGGGRDALLARIAEIIAMSRAHPGAPLLHLVCNGCGHIVRYETADDIPAESVPCGCPGGWFIEYA